MLQLQRYNHRPISYMMFLDGIDDTVTDDVTDDVEDTNDHTDSALDALLEAMEAVDGKCFYYHRYLDQTVYLRSKR